MSTAVAEAPASGADQATATVSTQRPGLVRWIGQPIIVILAVAGCLIWVQLFTGDEVQARSLGVGTLLDLLKEHLGISLAATIITSLIAIPLGVLLTRGPLRRFSKPIITIAGFGQAAPAIGLIALGAVLFNIGARGAVAALAVYGILPIVANTVAGLDSVDPRLVEAARGMGLSSVATLFRVELPLSLGVIVAGVRTALVLIVGTAALASLTGAGGLGSLITTGIKLKQDTVLVVGAILVAALALFIDWLARLIELAAAPKGLNR